MAGEDRKEVVLEYPLKFKKKDGLYKIIDKVYVRKFRVKDLKNFPKKALDGENISKVDIKDMLPLIAGICESDGSSLTLDEAGEIVIEDLLKIVSILDTSVLGFSNPLGEIGKE